VRALTAEGADVAFSYCSSRAEAQKELAALHEQGRRAFALAADARVPGEMVGFVNEASRALGGLDILVNNVGVFRDVPFDEIGEDVLDEAFDVNVKAAVMATRAAAPHMRRRGAGVVVNVASLGGMRPWKSHLPYCASKAALIMATRCMALALAPTIRVNAVAPGLLDEPVPPAALARRVPLGRFGRLEEVVAAVLFLVAGAGYVTGEVLCVDGGRGWA
jgi:NAD(P)-dependent dehydrogenase (short-subunit alcohol dehydrogenase family)